MAYSTEIATCSKMVEAMPYSRTLLVTCSLLAMTAPASADLKLWQQNFVGCSVSASPYATQVLFKDGDKVRPLMQISGMNAWAVPTDHGEEVALTTQDGLTIYGRIIGPQGEDISAALLTTRPTIIPQESSLDGPSFGIRQSILPAPSGSPAALAPAAAPRTQSALSSSQAILPLLPFNSATTARASPGSAAPASAVDQKGLAQAPVQAAPGAPSQAASLGSDTVMDVPRATNVDQLIEQAKSFAMWFPINTPRPDAPLIYVFVDPTCPHCAWSFDQLAPRIAEGSVNLRIILTPILSRQAFDVAASILHQPDIPRTLLDQLRSVLGSGMPAPHVDPSTFDAKVTDGLRRNVLWMRANGAPGVPFYLYRTKAGGQFAFGSLTDAELAAALPEDTAAAPIPLAGNEAPAQGAPRP
jgi:hypothetical protein